MTDLRIGPSRIAGTGVFAAREFQAGETVHVLDDSRTVDAAHPLDAAAGEESRHCDYLARGRVVLMPEPERYINSSCDPNTVVVTRGGRRHVVALRRVREGDEITYDYLINCDGDEVWQCRCGAARCRGTVPGSFFDLPVDEQRRLRPLLDGWFARAHQARLAALDASAHTVVVRGATGADVAALARLSAELGYPVDESVLGARLAALTRDDQAVLVACGRAGEVLGWIHGAEQLLLETGRRCEILGLVVAGGHRRRGVGQQLLAAVEGWARGRGLPEIAVRSNVVRVESHPFYAKMGYGLAKTQHAYRKPLASAEDTETPR
jgi:GNAT superfamily N-acetyltransferase